MNETDNTRTLYSGVASDMDIATIAEAIQETLGFHGISFGTDEKVVNEATGKVMRERGEATAQTITMTIVVSPYVETKEHTNVTE